MLLSFLLQFTHCVPSSYTSKRFNVPLPNPTTFAKTNTFLVCQEGWPPTNTQCVQIKQKFHFTTLILWVHNLNALSAPQIQLQKKTKKIENNQITNALTYILLRRTHSRSIQVHQLANITTHLSVRVPNIPNFQPNLGKKVKDNLRFVQFHITVCI